MFVLGELNLGILHFCLSAAEKGYSMRLRLRFSPSAPLPLGKCDMLPGSGYASIWWWVYPSQGYNIFT